MKDRTPFSPDQRLLLLRGEVRQPGAQLADRFCLIPLVGQAEDGRDQRAWRCFGPINANMLPFIS